jgi:hypothetical protein
MTAAGRPFLAAGVDTRYIAVLRVVVIRDSQTSDCSDFEELNNGDGAEGFRPGAAKFYGTRFERNAREFWIS